MAKRFLLSLASIVVLATGTIQAQNDIPKTDYTPEFVLKTNMLYDLTTSINLGAELKTSDKYTVDLSVNYNPWTFSNNKKFKHVLVQPEVRRWNDGAFKGSFWGFHGIYAYYNVGGIDLSSSLKDHRYQGSLYGLGISYGYQWVLSPVWRLEASVGLGYVHSNYDKYECQTCGKFIKSGNKNYFGPTKAALSLIYVIK